MNCKMFHVLILEYRDRSYIINYYMDLCWHWRRLYIRNTHFRIYFFLPSHFIWVKLFLWIVFAMKIFFLYLSHELRKKHWYVNSIYMYENKMPYFKKSITIFNSGAHRQMLCIKVWFRYLYKLVYVLVLFFIGNRMETIYRELVVKSLLI